MRHLRFVLVALALGAWAAGPMPSAAAQTAPSYQSSEPAKDAMLDHPPAEVKVTFDQPLDQSSWMNVLDECGKEIDAGPATVDLNELTVDIGDTPSGMYKVVYKAVGLAGATGSSASSFEFMVHHGEPCAGGSSHHHGGGKMNHHGGHGGHDMHGGHDGDHQGHDGHSGMDMAGMDHSGHSGMDMAGMDHSGHTMDMAHGSEHDAGHHHHGAGHGGAPSRTGGAEPPPLAGGTGGVPVGADGEAVLIGLGLALAVGVLGGWLLRMSSTLAGI